MKTSLNPKLITCILPKGKATNILSLLHEEKKIDSANMYSGRGGGRRGRLEVDVLTVVVSEERADEIFEYIYLNAEVGNFHGGFMYQAKLNKTTPFTLPQIPGQRETQ